MTQNQWHHAPAHCLKATGAYIITAATLHKELLFKSSQTLDLLQTILFEVAECYHLELKAWALFPNHYHLILLTYPHSRQLKSFVNHLHSMSARKLNKMTGHKGRQVWHQYWDTQLTYEKSYYARLNYVMRNPVRHGLVENPEDYRWCSARWFKENAEPGHFRTVTSFKTNTVHVNDDF